MPPKHDVSQALLLTIIAVAGVLMVVVGAVMVLTDGLTTPFFSNSIEQSLGTRLPVDDTTDFINDPNPVTSLPETTLAQFVLTPTRTFTENGVEYTESEAVFSQLQGNTLTVTIGQETLQATLNNNTVVRQIKNYLINPESDSMSGVVHEAVDSSQLAAVKAGDKLRLTYFQDGNTTRIAQVIIYPVER